MIRGVVLALLLLPMATSGCANDPMFGDCDYPPWTVDWSEPGLNDRLPGDGSVSGYNVTSELEQGSLVLDDPRLDARWGAGNYSLLSLAWVAPGSTHRFDGGQILLDADGHVSTHAFDGTDPGTVHRNLVAFLENITAASSDEINETADAVVASKAFFGQIPVKYARDPVMVQTVPEADLRDAYRFAAPVDIPFQLGTVYASQVGDVDASVSPLGATVHVDNWTFRFDLLERTVEKSFEKADVTLTVDRFDHATFAVVADQRPPKEYMLDLLETTFADLDLGTPSVTDPTFQSIVGCLAT